MTPNPSPITGILDESEVYIDFGKHEGVTVRELAEIDPNLYQTLANEKLQGAYAIRRTKDKTFRLFLNSNSQLDQ